MQPSSPLPLLFLVLASVAFAVAAVRPTPMQQMQDELREGLRTVLIVLRTVSDRLERHERRERQLGDELRQTLAAQDTKQRAADATLANMAVILGRTDERLLRLESVLAQRDDRDRDQLLHLAEGQERLAQALRDWQQTTAAAQNAVSSSSAGDASLEAMGARVDRVASAVERLEKAGRVEAEALRAAASALLATEAKWRLHAAETDRLLARYKNHLEETEGNMKNHKEIDWHPVFLSALQAQEEALRDLQRFSKLTSHTIQTLPTREEMTVVNNRTLDALEAARLQLTIDQEKAVSRLERISEEQRNVATKEHEELATAISEQSEAAEAQADRIRQSYDQLHAQVLELQSAEKVLIQTADNVLDTKRRIEYGVHQILLEVGDLVKLQTSSLNETMNRRFDNISDTILQHQSGALTNLSARIEAEISQVWRQIGILYKQLTDSANVLDNLQAQTDQYVNGSGAVMDSLERKVALITSRMHEVEDNLNHLLGRLSLFSNEFINVRNGLGNALDSIRSTFEEAKEQMKNVTPQTSTAKAEPFSFDYIAAE